MDFPLTVVIPGLFIISCHYILAVEVLDYNESTPDIEQELDKRVFDSISGHVLHGFNKRRLDSIAHNRGFSGFTSKRLYGIDDLGLTKTMAKRPFDHINYDTDSAFVKRRPANHRNDDRLNWFIQRPINMVGGIAPKVYREQPVNAIYVGGENRLARNPRYFNRWYNLMSDVRLNGFTKRADEVVDGELLEYQP